MPARRSPTRCRSCSSGVARSLDDAAGRAPASRARRAPAKRTRSRRSPRPKRPRRARWNELPVLTSVNPLRDAEAGRDACCSAAPTRTRRDAAGAGLPALRPRQGARVRRSRTRGSGRCTRRCRSRTDARELLAAAAAVAGRRRARRRSTCTRSTERVEAGEPVTLDRRGRRQAFVELNDARVVAKVTDPKGNDRRRADAVDRRAQRRVPRHLPAGRPTGMYAARGRGDARRQAARHRRRRTSAPRRATPSTSTRRCTRRG